MDNNERNKQTIMKTKLVSILLVITSVFIFTSCGDSKDSVVDDMVELIHETPEVMKSEDKDKIAAHTEKMKELEKRAKALGMDLSSEGALTADQKKRLDDAMKSADGIIKE